MRRMMRRMVEDRSGERRIQQGIAYYLLHTQKSAKPLEIQMKYCRVFTINSSTVEWTKGRSKQIKQHGELIPRS